MKGLICRQLLLLIAIPVFGYCQWDSSHNHLEASLNYQNHLHYFGRTDSLHSSGEWASLGFQLKNGLYAQGNAILLQNSAQPTNYTGTTIESGWRFPQGKHWSGNVFYTQFLYKDNSVLVQSAIKEQTGLNLVFTNTIITVNMGGDLKFSNQTDIGASFGLDHIFILKPHGSHQAFGIAPSAYLYAGTQNFTNTYIQKLNFLGIPLGQQQFTRQVSAFNVLTYEFSLPLVWVMGKFNIAVIPAYVLPQNLVMVANHPELSEQGKNLLYVNTRVGIKF